MYYRVGYLTYLTTSFVDRDMIMRHYWGLGVGHTYARISTIAARSLYLKTQPQHQSETQPQSETQHQSEIDLIMEAPLENVDEESELGDDDMVYSEDDHHDWDSDENDDTLHDLD